MSYVNYLETSVSYHLQRVIDTPPFGPLSGLGGVRASKPACMSPAIRRALNFALHMGNRDQTRGRQNLLRVLHVR
jgi:hypothetical protein